MSVHTLKAFKRHSKSQSGSFFFALMSRMMSSFSPAGALSESMSVVKPNS